MKTRKPRGARKARPAKTKTTNTASTKRGRKTRQAPSWLLRRQDLDDIARRRVLMVLSVLSGEIGVADAVKQATISQTTYQQYETRALEAMLHALTPDGTESGISASPTRRIAELEAKVLELEKGKRRAERLLLVTRNIVKPGSVTTGAGRQAKRRARPSSMRPGSKPLKSSAMSTTQLPTTAAPSTPTTNGGDEH